MRMLAAVLVTLASLSAQAQDRVALPLSSYGGLSPDRFFTECKPLWNLLNGASGLANEVDQRLASACMAYVQTVLWVGCRRTDVPLYEALVAFDKALKTPTARTALRTDEFLVTSLQKANQCRRPNQAD
jgi:hypothetical protein